MLISTTTLSEHTADYKNSMMMAYGFFIYLLYVMVAGFCLFYYTKSLLLMMLGPQFIVQSIRLNGIFRRSKKRAGMYI